MELQFKAKKSVALKIVSNCVAGISDHITCFKSVSNIGTQVGLSILLIGEANSTGFHTTLVQKRNYISLDMQIFGQYISCCDEDISTNKEVHCFDGDIATDTMLFIFRHRVRHRRRVVHI